MLWSQNIKGLKKVAPPQMTEPVLRVVAKQVPEGDHIADSRKICNAKENFDHSLTIRKIFMFPFPFKSKFNWNNKEMDPRNKITKINKNY